MLREGRAILMVVEREPCGHTVHFKKKDRSLKVREQG